MSTRPLGGSGVTSASGTLPGSAPRLKLQVPPDLDRTLLRARLVDRVATSTERVVTIVAPAGYGKSTLLGQLAGRLPNVGYVRLDETDDDPIMLIGDLLDALETIVAIPAGIRSSIATPAENTGFRAPARFTQTLAAAPVPASLLLDDCHLVRDRVALDWVGWIVG